MKSKAWRAGSAFHGSAQNLELASIDAQAGGRPGFDRAQAYGHVAVVVSVWLYFLNDDDDEGKTL